MQNCALLFRCRFLSAAFGLALALSTIGDSKALGGVLGGTLSKAHAQDSPSPDVNPFVPLARKVLPSVVNVSTLSAVRSPFSRGESDDYFRQFFEEFFGSPNRLRTSPSERPADNSRSSPRPIPRTSSLGTGFIIDSSGIILTNNHVVGDAQEIKIKFTESTEEQPSQAEIVGRDPELDVALLQVKSARELVPLPLGDSDAVEVGEFVIAVGNPFAQGHSVSHGIISAKGRVAPQFPLGNYLQTDAPINPGNSGGPLINLRGEVIGINNAIEARAQGISFAIPISLVKTVLPQLRAHGTVTRGYVGIMTEALTPDIARKLSVDPNLRAPYVSQLYPGDPAERAGIKSYDIILEVSGHRVQTPAELMFSVSGSSIGKSLIFKILRGGATLEIPVVVGKRPFPQEYARAKR